MSRLSLLLAASAVALLASSAHAEDAVVLPTIVITPTRAPVPLNQIASSMTVISREDIERQNKPEVADLLRQVPGITVANNGGDGQPTRLFMRGTNSNHVLVLVDGMSVNDPSDPSDAFDFSNLTTDNIERIEILRGPQSTLYGSQAIGGVINIITKQGMGRPQNNAFAEYGRYNSYRGGVGTSGEVGRTVYNFQASSGHTNGISSLDKKFGGFEKDGDDNYTLSANVASRLTDNFVAKLATRYNRNNAEFDSPGGFTRPADDPLPVNDSRQLNARASGELTLLDGKWVQELGISTLDLNRDQITEYFDSLGNPFFGRQQYLGRRDAIDWLNHWKLMPDNVLTLGAEAYSDHFKTDTTSEVNVDNQAIFADDQWNITRDLFVNGGVRIDDHQAFGTEFTWKIAPGYRIAATGTTLKTTYGTGFKAPSLSQLYDPSSGNPALQPEKSKGWDAGFEQVLWGDKLTFGSTFFRNDIRQLIGFNNAPPFTTINTGKARTEGVENVITWRPLLNWTFNGNYNYTLAEDRTNNQELLRRPKHQVNLGAVYQYTNAWDMGGDMRYSSSRRDIDINFPFGRVYVKSFTVFDLNTNYRLNQNVTLYARLENLFDKRYEEVYAYGEPGMALYVGAKANF